MPPRKGVGKKKKEKQKAIQLVFLLQLVFISLEEV